MLRARSLHAQRGASLVELLIGSCVGLFVLSGAASLQLHQAQTHRHTHLQLRLQDEARTTLRILEREVRRAGAGLSESQALQAQGSAFWEGQSGSLHLLHRPTASGVGTVQSRVIRWRDGQLEMRIDEGGFQPLTDRSLLNVARFEAQIDSRPMPLAGRSEPCDDSARVQERQLTLRFVLELRSAPSQTESRTLRLPLPPVLTLGACA